MEQRCINALVVFSAESRNLKKALIALAKERLTNKQKLILNYLKYNQCSLNITRIVGILAKELSCSKSAIWNNVNSLKKACLLDYGNLERRGIPVSLTENGLIISAALRDKK